MSCHSESGDHLLMGCAFSWNVWKCIADDLGIKIEAQQTFRQFYDWWMIRRASNRVRKRFFTLAFFCHDMEYLEQEEYDGFPQSKL